MRIIAGIARGRRLYSPPTGTRPTSDRVREALFSSLDGLVGEWTAVHFLDVCAGSGAVGLEALSRGAAQATLVEEDRRCLDVLRRNVSAVGVDADVVMADARTWNPGDRTFDVVYVDPPYAMSDEDLRQILVNLTSGAHLAPRALVVLERAVRSASPWPEEGWEELRRRDYGETSLWYGRREDA
ncbi:MAG: 16S rRNA (guanine(966)-N(2))-methyltransferase RsmD [Candidatus Nanopelagicales bacterium]